MHLVFYVRITYKDDNQSIVKVTATNGRNAALKAMRNTTRDDVARLTTGEGVPKTKRNQEIARNRKVGAQRRRKREREERIWVTDGVNSLGSLHEYNKAKQTKPPTED